MAARINKIRHDENTRAKIKVAKYLNILDEAAEGTRKLENNQVKAIEILLSKSLPSLQSVEHSGEISTTKVIRTPSPTSDLDSWRQTYSDQPNPKEIN